MFLYHMGNEAFFFEPNSESSLGYYYYYHYKLSVLVLLENYIKLLYIFPKKMLYALSLIIVFCLMQYICRTELFIAKRI
jgi:hypothetical protein